MRTCAECGRLVAPGEDHPHLLDDVPSPAAPSPTIAQPLSEEPRVTLMVRVEGDQILVTVPPLGGEVLIGRALDSPLSQRLAQWRNVSRRHLAIRVRAGSMYMTDSSKNGTWLDGLPLSKGEAVNAGTSCQLQLARNRHLTISIVSNRDGAG